MKEEKNSLPELLDLIDSAPGSDKKYFCRLGFCKQRTASLVATILGVKEVNFELIIDSDGIRHTLAQHGLAKSRLETARGQLPLTENDILSLSNWLSVSTSVRAGQVKPGKQPRLEIESVDSTGTTTVIMEWRPGRKQLVLVTMYKKRPAV